MQKMEKYSIPINLNDCSMIYKYEHFISALKEKHPEVTESSLKKIVKKGLFGINKTMRGSGELLIRGTTVKGKND